MQKTISMLTKLSMQINLAWFKKGTLEHPNYIKFNGKTVKEYYCFLKETLEENARYTMQFSYKNGGNIVSIMLDIDKKRTIMIHKAKKEWYLWKNKC